MLEVRIFGSKFFFKKIAKRGGDNSAARHPGRRQATQAIGGLLNLDFYFSILKILKKNLKFFFFKILKKKNLNLKKKKNFNFFFFFFFWYRSV